MEITVSKAILTILHISNIVCDMNLAGARHHAQSTSRAPPIPMDAVTLAEKDAEIGKLQV